MKPVFPAKLTEGSHVRVIAPARSRALVTQGNHHALVAQQHLDEMGLVVTFGDHVDERDRYDSSSIESRVADLHAAFADPEVDGILTVLGGFNSNELLPHLDYELIAANPKILCGFSDITALQNAITATTGMVTYSGPHWSTFAMRDHNEQTRKWFRDTLMTNDGVVIEPGQWFTDDAWFLNQNDRTQIATDGWWSIQPGHTQGRIVGGNLCTLNLLQGTRYMPSLEDVLLFVEDDAIVSASDFRRDLHSLMQVPGAETVRGVVIGRFQQASEVERVDIELLVASLPSLKGKPVLANVDFGHTNPLMTFPIGGNATIESGVLPCITITQH